MNSSNDAPQHSPDTFSWADFDGVLFDLDGVITPTADVHEHAWTELFADHGFDGADYVRFVDGKPRYDGVRSYLASRGITLPDGHPDDPPGNETVCALGNRKNALFNAIIERDGIAPYDSSVQTIAHLEEIGVPAAIVSSSKNARPVLHAAGLGDRFDIVVDGIVSAELGLPGKPAPDGYRLGARRLGIDPARSIVVEDATSGVAAGNAGGFAVTIGIDRGAGRHALLEHGATFVVDDLGELLPDES